jgi:hypothetical protein
MGENQPPKKVNEVRRPEENMKITIFFVPVVIF